MISSLKKSGSVYYCSNCMMRQHTPIKPNCFFCGDFFSNYESLKIDDYKEQEKLINDMKKKEELILK